MVLSPGSLLPDFLEDKNSTSVGLQLKSDWSNTDKSWLSDLSSCHFLSFADWSMVAGSDHCYHCTNVWGCSRNEV